MAARGEERTAAGHALWLRHLERVRVSVSTADEQQVLEDHRIAGGGHAHARRGLGRAEEEALDGGRRRLCARHADGLETPVCLDAQERTQLTLHRRPRLDRSAVGERKVFELLTDDLDLDDEAPEIIHGCRRAGDDEDWKHHGHEHHKVALEVFWHPEGIHRVAADGLELGRRRREAVANALENRHVKARHGGTRERDGWNTERRPLLCERE